ncbi:MAG: exosortase/archaeosortase family protein [Thermogutta sp.]|nr:exosortase/archaeosortase family protein [Thermogutta sp.]
MSASDRQTTPADFPLEQPRLAWFFGVLLAVVVWSYWNSLSEAAIAWRGAQYSHGLFVPLIATFLLWVRRLGGTFDWQWQTTTEKWRLVAVGGVLALAWFSYIASERLGQQAAPGEAVSLTAASGLGFMAAMLYATGLLTWATFAADSWLQHSLESEKQRQNDEDKTHLRGELAGEALASGTQTALVRGRYVGLFILIVAVALRLASAYVGLDVAEMWTLPLALLGAGVCTIGWRSLRWSWPAVVVLFFAFPLPFGVERTILVPLQGIAAQGGAYLLQSLGLEASTEGAHFIRLGEFQLGVVEQCSGLRMTTVFITLVFVYVVVVPTPKWQIPVLLLSSIPIALAVNILRITVTGTLYVYGSRELAQHVFHDWAGYLMPLAAVALLLLLRVLLDNLFIKVEEQDVPLAQRLEPAKKGST